MDVQFWYSHKHNQYLCGPKLQGFFYWTSGLGIPRRKYFRDCFHICIYFIWMQGRCIQCSFWQVWKPVSSTIWPSKPSQPADSSGTCPLRGIQSWALAIVRVNASITPMQKITRDAVSRIYKNWLGVGWRGNGSKRQGSFKNLRFYFHKEKLFLIFFYICT